MSAAAFERLLDILEFGAKAAIALGAVWAFIAKVATPLIEWRRRARKQELRTAFEAELQLLNSMVETANELVSDTEETVLQVRALFGDMDRVLEIATDNRERIDEINQLLDQLGFSSERRSDSERRAEIDAMLDSLNEERRRRRRGEPKPPQESGT